MIAPSNDRSLNMLEVRNLPQSLLPTAPSHRSPIAAARCLMAASAIGCSSPKSPPASCSEPGSCEVGYSHQGKTPNTFDPCLLFKRPWKNAI